VALLCGTPATNETSHSFASEGDVHILEHGEAGKDARQLERQPDAQAAYLFGCRACDRTGKLTEGWNDFTWKGGNLH
jgi:hypothetical protein